MATLSGLGWGCGEEVWSHLRGLALLLVRKNEGVKYEGQRVGVATTESRGDGDISGQELQACPGGVAPAYTLSTAARHRLS